MARWHNNSITSTLPETNIAMENPPFWGIYQERCGFSWAMLVSGRVKSIKLSFITTWLSCYLLSCSAMTTLGHLAFFVAHISSSSKNLKSSPPIVIPKKETESSHLQKTTSKSHQSTMWKRIHRKMERNLGISQHAWRILTSPPVEQRPKHHSQPRKSHPVHRSEQRERVEGGRCIHLWKCSNQQNPSVESVNQSDFRFFSVCEICDEYSQFEFIADLLIPWGSCEPVPCRSRRSLWKWGLPFAGWEDEFPFNRSWALYLSAFYLQPSAHDSHVSCI